mgnify:CR=1 FL=1
MNPVVEKLGSAVDDWVSSHHPNLVAVRRHLHAHPELAFAEFETTSYLEQRLRENRAEMRRKLGGKAVFVGWTATGVIADFLPTSIHDQLL